jgi:hypothetical protein
MLSTEGIVFGLLPTKLAQAREQMNFEAYDERMERLKKKGHKPFTMPLDQMALRGLLPTPTVFDSTGASANMKSSQVKEGSMHSVTLSRWANQMLPTPAASDYNAWGNQENWKGNDLVSTIHKATDQPGKTSHLNPLFVAEMMGFPPDWTVLPFRSGETSPSKPTEMP